MTTLYKFIPSNKQAPSFMPAFDGNQYMVTITWNVSAQRYYVNCQDLIGNLIFSVPLLSTEANIHLSSLVWDPYNNRIVATTREPHGFTVGEIVFVSIVNANPTTYNGNVNVLILNNTQFTYASSQDPGQYNYGGSVGFLISMTESYFNSTLVYRNGVFE